MEDQLFRGTSSVEQSYFDQRRKYKGRKRIMSELEEYMGRLAL